MAWIRSQIRQLKPALVIVDTMGQVLMEQPDLEENAYFGMARAMKPLRGITKETGAFLLALHHANKGKHGNVVDMILGSTAIGGAVDTAVGMEEWKYGKRAGALVASRQRYGSGLPKTLLTFDEQGTLRLEGEYAAIILKQNVDRVLGVMSHVPLTMDELSQLVPLRNRGYLNRVVQAAINERRIQRDGGGCKGSPFTYCLPQKAA